MKNVLFLYKHKASWALSDKAILQSFTKLDELFLTKKQYINIISIIKKVLMSEVLFCWFGSLFFLPIILFARVCNKKIIIVAGGFDVAFDNFTKHGAFNQNCVSRWLRRLLFKMADLILPVSESTRYQVLENISLNEDKIHTVYLGFTKPECQIKDFSLRKNQVVMIANINYKREKVKGFDQLILLASAMPETPFILIGEIQEELCINLPSNLELTGPLSFDGEKFNKIITNSKVALQLSHYESFGAAIIECAIRGCYPIVFSQYALKETIEEGWGALVTYGDISSVKNQILKSFSSTISEKTISHVYFNKFSLEKRRQALKTIIGCP